MWQSKLEITNPLPVCLLMLEASWLFPVCSPEISLQSPRGLAFLPGEAGGWCWEWNAWQAAPGPAGLPMPRPQPELRASETVPLCSHDSILMNSSVAGTMHACGVCCLCESRELAFSVLTM